MLQPSLLAIYAHPDDEAFSVGGTVAQYAANGICTYLVCATRGEVGGISDPDLATPETLGQVREAELRCAAETMGIAELIFLNYRDSGMAGTAENAHPQALINAPAEQVVHELVSIIRRLRPNVITTFEPNGGYGHPDHIAIHQRTVSAFHLAADPGYAPEVGEPWQVNRLFYSVIPRSFIMEFQEQLRAHGVKTDELDVFTEIEDSIPEDAINLVIDIANTVNDKWDALNCHRTQFGPDNLFRLLPEDVVKKMISREYFSLAWPVPPSGMKLESLFFAG